MTAQSTNFPYLGSPKRSLLNPLKSKTRWLGAVAIAVSIGLTPALPMLGSSSALYGATSLNELISLRDELLYILENPPESAGNSRQLMSLFPNQRREPSEQIIEQLRHVEVQIMIEQRANDNWKQAISLAHQAVDIGKSSPLSWETRQQMATFWQRAIANLQEIPQDSFLRGQATAKISEYQDNYNRLKLQLRNAQSEILEEIRVRSGLSRNATISVCNLNRHCASLRGSQTPASPASLIKVPVAIALLHKAAEEQVSFDQEIYVEGGNFTEDASSIRARQSYSLQMLMAQMIDHSSNIATNQLIDYLSADYINKLLERHGYQKTRVQFKLMGDRIMPFRPGRGRNSMTSDELTEMMVEIYNYEHPHSELLIDALGHQYDREIGYQALQGLKAQWLGEKTGQNSRVIGTTLAASIDGERYIITITDNSAGNIPQVRRAIAGIAEHIIMRGQL